jgi:uncharacterized membrane protein
VAGLAVAAYLTYAHYTSASALACPNTGALNCEKVTTSSYSHVFGIPVAVLGLVFFAVMLPLQSRRAWSSTWQPLRWGRMAWCLAGMGSVFWLLYAELYRLNAICIYCTSVHALTFLVLAVTAYATWMYEPPPAASGSTASS